MRQARSSRGLQALAAVCVFGFLFLLFAPSSPSVDAEALRLARLRKSAAAASDPLSPPTSAFRKSKEKNGVRVPPPVVHYQMNNLTASAFPAANNEKILILTPLARFYQKYWDNLVSLNYPHEHISLGYIIPKTDEGNLATAELQAQIQITQSGPEEQRFQSVTILRQDFDPAIPSQEEKERHQMKAQKARRASMARARNSLLFPLIGPDTSWVLWLDGDIIETPSSLIQDLASFDKPIINPNCFQRYKTDSGEDAIRPYDYNAWRDSDTAQQLAKNMEPDEILLEGYAEMATYRTLMAMLADKTDDRDTRKLMPLDGVGGTVLLVKAEVHRDGAMFPAFSFYHLIETEGFAKMARRLGWESWGLPNYFVYHVNES
jgi:mannan polymerase complexes MNN9 subunit